MMWFNYFFSSFAYSMTYQVGDIIIQRDAFKGGGGAIQMMTLSPYNHVGVVVEQGGKNRHSYRPCNLYPHSSVYK